ncbi:DUF3048 domain-containing protein [Egicoccus sp. AB-alg6-2]|uniref:DUF3048 domain-containing protein n=1 Tax=Egicoccus sp. AB-alg6-2 TaxID=3242692 RepID=UPI00359DECFA
MSLALSLHARGRALFAACLCGALLAGACASTEPETPVETAAAEPTEEPSPEPEEPAAEPEPEPEPDLPLAPLTGVPTEQDLAERPALVVKIENSPQARPQAGLDAADLVFEELVEGGVTRFITVFHSQVPELAGPVRSARPIDIQIASGVAERPGFAYSGARKEVQGMLGASGLVLVTEGEGGFHRDASRRAPHNLYVHTPATFETVAARGATPPTEAAAFTFSEQPPACPEEFPGCLAAGADIEVAMSGSFRTGFTYDTAAGVYRRLQNGAPFTVTGEGIVGAANVVVIGARHYRSGCCDTAGNPYDETDATGQGRAVVLRDGAWYEARWDKPDATAPLRLLDASGAALPLKPGPTWLLLPDASRLPAVPTS